MRLERDKRKLPSSEREEGRHLNRICFCSLSNDGDKKKRNKNHLRRLRRSTSPAATLFCICKLPLSLPSLGKLSSISCTSLGSVSCSGSPTTKLTGASGISLARADPEELIQWTVSLLDPAESEDVSSARSVLPSKTHSRGVHARSGGVGSIVRKVIRCVWITAISLGRTNAKGASESLLLTRRNSTRRIARKRRVLRQTGSVRESLPFAWRKEEEEDRREERAVATHVARDSPWIVLRETHRCLEFWRK